MRLIGTVESEKKAFIIYSILLEEGVHSTYEQQFDEKENRMSTAIWIYEEDQVEKAVEILEAFKSNPNDPRYAQIEFPQGLPQTPDPMASRQKNETVTQKKPPSSPITYAILLTCVLLFMWNGIEQYNMIKKSGKLAVQLGFTPLQQDLMFDYPKSNQAMDALLESGSLKGIKELKDLPQEQLRAFEHVQKLPNFQGYLPYLVYWLKQVPPPTTLDGPLFLKIRQGEAWRLFTPCLLHAGILHILFNMAWAWLLIKQVEQRLSKWKTLLLMMLIGIVSNMAQYAVSGPYFLGFSGIVVGLVGFIWVRQRKAPWEGYPLQRSTFLFICIFVMAMFALEIFSLVTSAITAKEISANIANTAHIIGGLIGAWFGTLPFFSRSVK